MAKIKTDKEREDRIAMEIVADAHDAEERAMGWYGYLQDELVFPFAARCVSKRAISPLRVGDEVEVTAMADGDECGHEMFVEIRWDRGGLAVPLSQLKPVDAEDETAQAVEDWHYWTQAGYEL